MLSVLMDMPILDISWEGNHTTHDLLQLASFTQDRVFKVHLCRSMGQRLVPRAIRPCVVLPHFIGVFAGGRWSFSHLCEHPCTGVCVGVCFRFSWVRARGWDRWVTWQFSV